MNQISWKKSLLVICKILGLFVNTLPANGKYFLLKRDNLTQPIQMELSNKQKTFSNYFGKFFKSRSNFEQFGKKADPDRLCISDIMDCERRG